jgi:hypothetical protein
VAYFLKRADKGRVSSALASASIPTHETAPVLADNTPSNGIACTSSTPIAAVKATAKALIEGGVPVYVVSSATKRLETRQLQIQVLHYRRALINRYAPLTGSEIDKLETCPTALGFFNAGNGAYDHGIH